MKKLSVFALSASIALVCAVPASFNWSPAKFSLDTAEARIVLWRENYHRAILDFCNSIGTKRTYRDVCSLSAFGGKADKTLSDGVTPTPSPFHNLSFCE